MKVTKYGVATICYGREVDRNWYSTKEEAEKRTRGEVNGTYRKYIGTREVDLFCECCDKDLKLGDTYIKVDEDTRYCRDCYEESSVTYYMVGGESVGTDEEVGAYDDYDLEAEEKVCKDCGCKMSECAKMWKNQRKCCPDCKCKCEIEEEEECSMKQK